MIYRKFSYLQARLLLYKQDELRSLERRLDYMDALHENSDPDLLTSRETDDKRSGRRKALLGKIEQSFVEYSEFFNPCSDGDFGQLC